MAEKAHAAGKREPEAWAFFSSIYGYLLGYPKFPQPAGQSRSDMFCPVISGTFKLFLAKTKAAVTLPLSCRIYSFSNGKKASSHLTQWIIYTIVQVQLVKGVKQGQRFARCHL